jgi:chromosome segregation ATPase
MSHRNAKFHSRKRSLSGPPSPVSDASTPKSGRSASSDKGKPLYRRKSKLKLGKTSNVKVAIRVRPLNTREVDLQDGKIISIDEGTSLGSNIKTIEITKRLFSDNIDSHGGHGDTSTEEKKYQYHYDYVYDEDCTQLDLFEDMGNEVVDGAFEGYNGCILAYGQTGSGKTHTMMGDSDQPGIIPNVVRGVFERNLESDEELRIHVHFVEIYQEKVRDLLDADSIGQQAGKPIKGLKVRTHPTLGTYVEGVKKMAVGNSSDVMDFINSGNLARITAGTKMNSRSSRSHAIFTIEIVYTKGSKSFRSSIQLVDLAGSERLKNSQAEGKRKDEAAAINLSLSTLNKVISSLVKNQKHRSKQVVAFRESVLTRLLEKSISGQAKTFMICAVSPASSNFEQTLSTLKYAASARQITNVIKANTASNRDTIHALNLEILNLRRELEEAQLRGDGDGDGDGGGGGIRPSPINVNGKKFKDASELADEIAHLEQEVGRVNEDWQQKLKESSTAKKSLELVIEEQASRYERLVGEQKDLMAELATARLRQKKEVAAMKRQVKKDIGAALNMQIEQMRKMFEEETKRKLDVKDVEIEQMQITLDAKSDELASSIQEIGAMTLDMHGMKGEIDKLNEKLTLSNKERDDAISMQQDILQSNKKTSSELDVLKKANENLAFKLKNIMQVFHEPANEFEQVDIEIARDNKLQHMQYVNYTTLDEDDDNLVVTIVDDELENVSADNMKGSMSTLDGMGIRESMSTLDNSNEHEHEYNMDMKGSMSTLDDIRGSMSTLDDIRGSMSTLDDMDMKGSKHEDNMVSEIENHISYLSRKIEELKHEKEEAKELKERVKILESDVALRDNELSSAAKMIEYKQLMLDATEKENKELTIIKEQFSAISDKLKQDINMRDEKYNKLLLEMKNLSIENEGLAKSIDAAASIREGLKVELTTIQEERIDIGRQLQEALDTITIEKEKNTKMSLEKIQTAQQNISLQTKLSSENEDLRQKIEEMGKLIQDSSNELKEKMAEIDMYKSSMHESNDREIRITILEKKNFQLIDDMQELIRTNKQDNTQLQKEILVLQEKNQELMETKTQQLEQLTKLTEKLESTKEEIKISEEKFLTIQTSLHEKNQELMQDNTQCIEKLQKEISTLQEKNQELMQELEQLTKLYQELEINMQKLVKSSEQENQELMQDNTQLQKEISTLQEKNQELMETKTQQLEQLTKLTEKLESTKEEIKISEEIKIHQTEQLTKLTEELKSTEQDNTQLQKEILTLQTSLHEKEQKLAKLTEEYKLLHSDYLQVKSECTNMRELFGRIMGDNQGLSTQLSDKDKQLLRIKNQFASIAAREAARLKNLGTILGVVQQLKNSVEDSDSDDDNNTNS